MSIFDAKTPEQVANFIQDEKERYSYDSLPEDVIEALIYRHVASYDHTVPYNKVKIEMSDLTYGQLKNRRESLSAIARAKEIIQKEEAKIVTQNALLQTLAEAFKSVKE